MINAKDEFIFLRDKLKKIAVLLCSDKLEDKMETAFLVGCLHSICHENSLKF